MDFVGILTNRVLEMGRALVAHLPQIVAALLLLVVTWFLARTVARGLVSAFTRTRLRQSLRDLFTKLLQAAIWLGGLMTAAMILFPSLTPGKFVTVFGVGSVAIGFAFKDVFENFLAGIVILMRNTIEIGDFIESGDFIGRVEKITVRDTLIRQTDGQRIVLPNAQLFKQPVRVLTDRDRRRVTIICGVAYDENLDEARTVMAEAVRTAESVIADEPVEVYAREFGASSVDFEVTWWTGATPAAIRASRDEVITAVKGALDEAGIEIPFPYRTLTFKEPLVTEARELAATTG